MEKVAKQVFFFGSQQKICRNMATISRCGYLFFGGRGFYVVLMCCGQVSRFSHFVFGGEEIFPFLYLYENSALFRM